MTMSSLPSRMGLRAPEVPFSRKSEFAAPYAAPHLFLFRSPVPPTPATTLDAARPEGRRFSKQNL